MSMSRFRDLVKVLDLTTEQKLILENHYKNGITFIDTIKLSEWKEIEAINNYNRLWDDCNLYLNAIAVREGNGHSCEITWGNI